MNIVICELPNALTPVFGGVAPPTTFHHKFDMNDMRKAKINETKSRPATELFWIESAIDAGVEFKRPKMVTTGSTVIEGKTYNIVDYASSAGPAYRELAY